MNEPIKWQELTPSQRDALVHEKVMQCSIDTEICMHQRGMFEVTCPECKSMWEEYDPHHLHLHGKSVPPYTTSLDAAWKALLTTGFGGKYTGKSDIRVLARELLGTDDHDLDPFYILGFVSAWTPESICIAALRSCGCEVINER